MANTPHILWADDEIDLLRPHLLFLENKGYDVTSVTNGADAVAEVEAHPFDIILLDEQMPGMDGLETLGKIKALRPEVHVVMVTKSEEERLMEEALGGQISDYLTKPVNPSQILLTCKRLLDRQRIRQQSLSQRYLQSFNRIAQRLQEALDWHDWIDLYTELVGYDLELEGDEGARQILGDQFRDANRVFGDFIEAEYPDWIADAGRSPDAARPVLSHDIVPRHVLPALKEASPVVFFVIDCMRYDQWLMFEPFLRPLYDIDLAFHYSILPTATPYSRNTIFSGLLPGDLTDRFPQLWTMAEENEHSRNQYEEALLHDQLERHHVEVSMRYDKLIATEDGRAFAQHVRDVAQHDLAAVVVNFVDILAHSRSDSDVIKELAPDEQAYRALTRTWFEHSWLYDAFRDLAKTDATVIVTTDHGAIRSLRSTKVIGDRETSTALRYKYGRNLQCDEQDAIFVRDPATYGLPARSMNTNYILAKEDYYFVYPTNFHHYENLYRDTMQHGGASLEEMILPVATMRPKS